MNVFEGSSEYKYASFTFSSSMLQLYARDTIIRSLATSLKLPGALKSVENATLHGCKFLRVASLALDSAGFLSSLRCDFRMSPVRIRFSPGGKARDESIHVLSSIKLVGSFGTPFCHILLSSPIRASLNCGSSNLDTDWDTATATRKRSPHWVLVVHLRWVLLHQSQTHKRY